MRVRVLIRPKAGILDPQGQAVELDQPADVHVAHPREAERRQRPLHRLPLRVEDPRLGPDQHAGSHGAVRSSQAENGSPASVS